MKSLSEWKMYKKLTETFIRFVKSWPNSPSNLPVHPLKEKVSTWIHLKNKQYEDIVGLSEVKAAHYRVLQSEEKFVKSQEDRRDLQRKMSLVQLKLHELHTELDRTPRGDDKYLALITQEHSIMKEERLLKDYFQLVEKEERENFAILSHTVRDSHEKERAQAEKTKYWSIIGSVLGTIVGVLGSSINNHLKMQELRQLVENASQNNHLFVNTEELSVRISSAIAQHLQPEKSKDFLEERWKELKCSIIEMIQQECDSQTKSISELSQLLKGSNNTTADDVNTVDVEKPYIKTLLEQQKQHSNRLLAISVFVIPTCTWALCKLLNL